MNTNKKRLLGAALTLAGVITLTHLTMDGYAMQSVVRWLPKHSRAVSGLINTISLNEWKLAAKTGDLEKIKTFLSQEKPPYSAYHSNFYEETTVFEEAVKSGNVEVVKLLMQEGSSISNRGTGVASSFLYAAEAGKKEMFQLILPYIDEELLDGEVCAFLVDARRLAHEKGHSNIIELLDRWEYGDINYEKCMKEMNKE